MRGSSFEVWTLGWVSEAPVRKTFRAREAAHSMMRRSPLTPINAKRRATPTIAGLETGEARMIRFSIVVAVVALLAAENTLRVEARDLSAGAAEYQLSCAGCHGLRGRGNGPMAKSLTRKPTDLSKLEEANDYQFPFLKVFQVIDGRTMVTDHGTREMPVWGRRYVEDVGDSRGPYGSETAVRERIEALVRHVQSLQER